MATESTTETTTETPKKRTRTKKRLLRNILIGTLVTLLVLVVAAGGVTAWTVTSSFPQTSGEIKVPGLTDTVTVSRDDAGIPTITAKNAGDLFRAQGYVHAQDRFWEMDFRRHVTSGRLSELFGESQLGTDTFIRTLGWRNVAEEEVQILDATSLAYYQSYADGVNAYLDTHSGANLSLEYVMLGLQNPDYSPEHWTPADSVAWLKAMAWDLRSNLEDEIERALLSGTFTPEQIAQIHPDYDYSKPTIVSDADPTTKTNAAPEAMPAAMHTAPGVDYAEAALRTSAALNNVPRLIGPAGSHVGSNSWVVSGQYTESGKPLLANDPHLGPVMPSVWYQVGLRCATVSPECPFDVSGYSFSGLPGVVIGHNADIAWGFTNLGPDVADLFIEKVTGDSYEYDGAAVPLDIREETIKVAGGADVPITIRSTKHGPIVSEITDDFTTITSTEAEKNGAQQAKDATEGYQLSLQWTALTPGRTPSAIFAVNAAHDWESFRAAATLFEVPSQNLLYADLEGNIGYQAPGLVPVRAQGDGTTPSPGWTSEYGWTGFIPQDQLPHVFNPSDGYIVTANNAAVAPDFPYLITKDWDYGYRAQQIEKRISDLISSDTKITAENMSDIQADTFNANAQHLTPLLISAAQSDDSSSGAARGAQLLEDWDYHDDRDSAQAAYFNIFWRNLLADAFAAKMPEATAPTGGSQWFQVMENLTPDPESAWWVDESRGIRNRDEMFVAAANEAWDEATSLMGSDPANWRWGKIHTLTIENASLGTSGIGAIEALLNRGPYELGGGSSVVDAVAWDASVGYEVNWVPSMRLVADLSDFDKSTWINLTGASGHAFSDHYVDQTPLWQNHQTRPWVFSAEAVEAAAKETLTLRP